MAIKHIFVPQLIKTMCGLVGSSEKNSLQNIYMLQSCQLVKVLKYPDAHSFQSYYTDQANK